MDKTILVTGGTGTVGRRLVPLLRNNGHAVRVGTRDPAGGGVRLDLRDPASVDAALDGADAVYLVSPGGELDPLAFLTPTIEAAARRGVKVVLQSVMGVKADDSIPYRQAELALIRSGAPHVILRPNWFSDNFETYWLAGIRGGVIALPAGDGRSSFIDVRDIAAAAAAALASDRFDGRDFNLTGPEAVSYADAAQLISQASGSRVAYHAVDDETFVAGMARAGVPVDYARFLAAIFHPVREGWTAAVTGSVEELTGRAPISLAQHVADNAAVYRPEREKASA